MELPVPMVPVPAPVAPAATARRGRGRAPRAWVRPREAKPAATETITMGETLGLLAAVSLFSSLTREELVPLAEAAAPVTFEPGETIVRQGDPGECVYAIVSGRVHVLTRVERDGTTTEAVVSRLGAGDTVGELSLIDSLPRSATCVAMTTAQCLRLDRQAFLEALERHWSLAKTLLVVLAGRLRAADARLAEQARDPLTGLYSRRALADLYERELARMQRERHRGVRPQGIAVLYADVDSFKSINDRYGHQTGDAVLRSVAMVLTSVSRATDIAARLGGDEFVLVLPAAGEAGAAEVMRRIHEALSATPPGPVPFTMSLGAAMVDLEQAPSLDQLLDEADAAMYRAKAEKRAC